jgi:hypothetical protein
MRRKEWSEDHDVYVSHDDVLHESDVVENPVTGDFVKNTDTLLEIGVDDFLADDWQVIPPPPPTMLFFVQALGHCLMGRKVRRRSWKTEESLLLHEDGYFYVANGCVMGRYKLSEDDLLATDWESIDEDTKAKGENYD